MMKEPGRMRPIRSGPVVAGIVLLAVGIAMLLDSTGMVSIEPGRLIGPFVMIGLGTLILTSRRRCGAGAGQGVAQAERQTRRGDGSTGGLWLIGVGLWMLMSQTHMFGLNFSTSWPLLLILMGLLIAIRGWR